MTTYISSLQVNYASSIQEATANEFVKRYIKKVFDLDFLYKHIVWRADANKIDFRGTKLACCLFGKLLILVSSATKQ